MSDTRPVPTNLDGWVGVTDLVVSYKHILHVLWSAPSSLVSVIGVGRPGIIEHLTGAARQDEPIITEALRELHRRGLVVLDEQTREIAVRRWCRFHKFNGRWAAAARIAFDKIESPAIKSVLVRHEGVNAVFPEKSKAEDPNSNSNVNNNAEAAPRAQARGLANAAAPSTEEQKRKHPRRTANQIECWYPSDDAPADDIEALFPAEQIAAAVATVKARRNSVGKPTSPVPAIVAEELERAQRAAVTAERRVAEEAQRAVEVQSILPIEIQRQRAAAAAAAFRTGRINAQEIIA